MFWQKKKDLEELINVCDTWMKVVPLKRRYFNKEVENTKLFNTI